MSADGGLAAWAERSGRRRGSGPTGGGLRFAFYGRVSPVPSGMRVCCASWLDRRLEKRQAGDCPLVRLSGSTRRGRQLTCEGSATGASATTSRGARHIVQAELGARCLSTSRSCAARIGTL